MYLNLIGQACAGKSTVANYLAKGHGFQIFRPSDVVRDFAAKHGIALKGRDDYIACHRTMYEQDSAVMVDRVLGLDGPRVCIDGLRAPIEAQELRRRYGMLVLALACPDEVRYARYLAERDTRARRDASRIASFDDFLRDDAADNISTDPRDPNVRAVMGLADIVIDTNREELEVLADVDRRLRAHI